MSLGPRARQRSKSPGIRRHRSQERIIPTKSTSNVSERPGPADNTQADAEASVPRPNIKVEPELVPIINSADEKEEGAPAGHNSNDEEKNKVT